MGLRFDGQAAMVTGAGRGMGRAIALALAREGARVVAADVDGETAEDTAAHARSDGGDAVAVSADIARPAEVERLFTEVDRRFGELHILVNNAGIGIAKPLLDYTEADYERQMGVNLKGLIFCTQAAARRMVTGRRGKIVNFASTAAFVSSSTPEAAYDASKGGVRSFTTSAAAELAPYGINVNAVAPGTILTDLTLQVLNTEEKMARAAAKIPLNRLGEPGDVVGPVLFLCSGEAAYITGQVLVVDGGWLLY
ncbi:MAG: SDR family NAD(P)-dependent oxidoreductase [Chloroflexota bacterium]